MALEDRILDVLRSMPKSTIVWSTISKIYEAGDLVKAIEGKDVDEITISDGIQYIDELLYIATDLLKRKSITEIQKDVQKVVEVL